MEESRSGDYAPKESWMLVADLFKICEEEVEAGDQPVNWLVSFLKLNASSVRYSLANYVSQKLLGLTVSVVFPDCTFLETPKKAAPAKAKQTATTKTIASKARTINETITKVCTVNHMDVNCFRPVEIAYYFAPGRKYADRHCFDCKLPFATTDPKKGDKSAYAELPNAKNTVWACKDFELNYCDCGTLVCGSCHTTRMMNTGRKRRPGQFSLNSKESSKKQRSSR